ncbi:D-arabinose 5-phosphate isomerase [Aureimonas sp. SA4125]|uniref:KpsF/GutQ family sugar-phosphate isomerase n=1 Tax=Aureimonas sp. SA4125 TaxID=2826993 RepID=UPI001CC5383F|nr:KpsF/GutQ family sugar-phosphate isomerase [Aureimonas sp. SA4125]BDA84023.1 D-arabinose 5-phosphate isomerase [Aureimonas sp. SA4125]
MQVDHPNLTRSAIDGDGNPAGPVSGSADPVRTARETIALEIAGLEALAASIDQRFTAVVEMIRACRGRVIVTGIGKSGHIGQKIAATLASTGTPAFFLHAAEAAHGDLGMVGTDDVVIAISNSGESTELQAIIEFCRRFHVLLVAMTARPQSALGRHADGILQLPDAVEACPLALAPMTSTTMSLAIGDALAAALIRARNFQRDDFAKFHPAGKLGARLLRMHDVLERLPDLKNIPGVSLGTLLPAVIVAISKGRRGATAVLDADGRLAGIITDGDLRRAMTDRGVFDKTAADIMTPNPRQISSDNLAVDALAICEMERIAALFVTGDDGRLVGLVDLKGLLSLGIV